MYHTGDIKYLTEYFNVVIHFDSRKTDFVTYINKKSYCGTIDSIDYYKDF